VKTRGPARWKDSCKCYARRARNHHVEGEAAAGRLAPTAERRGRLARIVMKPERAAELGHRFAACYFTYNRALLEKSYIEH
jgi:hypothetical protein